MHGFYVEKRTVPASSTLSADLAQHIFIRGAKGLVVVLTDKPHDLASITKKQWKELVRKVERERASTLNAGRIAELTVQIAWMKRLGFVIGLKYGLPAKGVLFIEANSLLAEPPICSTLYLAENISKEQFYMLTSWLPEKSVLVMYVEPN